MPIDLSKPIRSKNDHTEFRYAGTETHIILNEMDSQWGRVVMADELERDYENIPAPRKPREWLIVSYKPATFEYTAINNSTYGSGLDNKVRVIEWPFGAPLPDMPDE